MLISYGTDLGNFNTSVGYGYAGFQIITALEALGHRVVFREASAPVEIWFSQPEYWEWSNADSYKIGYVPWESTELPEFWVERMLEADEIWATSDWVKDVYESHGIPNVKVYEHGMDEMWTPRHRLARNGKVRFLHVGEPAPRKAGQLVFDVFKELYADNPYVSLTIKAHNFSTIRDKDRMGSIIGPVERHRNVNVITKDVPQEEMAMIYSTHDVLVYPSWGEGFGFIPLQALATGMPTICTAAWAPYRKYLGPLALDSSLGSNDWQAMHPGLMCVPSKDHLRYLMQTAVTDFEELSGWFYNNAEQVKSDYSWTKRTEEAFSHIVEKFS